MEADILRAITSLLDDWRKAIYDRKHRSAESGDAEVDSMMYAGWRGEVKAYSLALQDVEPALHQLSQDTRLDLQKLSESWLSAPEHHLGYSNVDEEIRLPTEDTERNHAIQTLQECAKQLGEGWS